MRSKPCTAHPHCQLSLALCCNLCWDLSWLKLLSTEQPRGKGKFFPLLLSPQRWAGLSNLNSQELSLKTPRVSVMKPQNCESNVLLSGYQVVSFRTEPEIVFLPTVQHRRDCTACPVVLNLLIFIKRVYAVWGIKDFGIPEQKHHGNPKKTCRKFWVEAVLLRMLH